MTAHSSVVRIILSNERLRGTRAPAYDAHLESGEFLCSSPQPEYDGARALLDRGFPPETLMVTRWAKDDYDAIVPARIGDLAKWTVWEGSGGLRLVKWTPLDKIDSTLRGGAQNRGISADPLSPDG